MRFVLFATLLALGACNPSAPTQQQISEGCARTATHNINWSSDAAPDVVTASAQGPSCAQAIVTLVIRDARGDPLWALATTYYDMTIGGRGPEEPPPVSEADMDTFLASWADININRSGDLPAWSEGADAPGEPMDGIAYHTDFNRESYEALRARNLPQACFAAATEATQCLVFDPMMHAPAVIVAFGV